MIRWVTYVDRFDDGLVCHVVIATGPDTKPTPDGGPWATEYEVHRDNFYRLEEVSKTAEDMLFRMIKTHAPKVFDQVRALGWMDGWGQTDFERGLTT